VVSTILQTADLPSRQLSALKRKAQRLGLTPQKYVKQLVLNDLALDRKARGTSIHELATPFQKALHGLPEDELDRIVERARRRKATH
jgi:hypothetical protein